MNKAVNEFVICRSVARVRVQRARTGVPITARESHRSTRTGYTFHMHCQPPRLLQGNLYNLVDFFNTDIIIQLARTQN